MRLAVRSKNENVTKLVAGSGTGFQMSRTVVEQQLEGTHVREGHQRDSLVSVHLRAAVVVNFDIGREQLDVAGVLHGAAKSRRQQLTRSGWGDCQELMQRR